MKKIILVLLVFFTCFGFSFELVSCRKKTDGVYYQYEFGKLNEDSYITLDGKKWSDDDGVMGTVKLKDDQITFYSDILGSNEEMFSGTIEDGVISISVFGSDIPEIYCQKGKEFELALKPTEGLAYELRGRYYAVTGLGTATDTNIVIPSEYEGKSVKEIANEAFEKCHSITSVTIGKNVETIGDAAFLCCTNLESISIGKDVKEIAVGAFNGCLNVTSIQVNEDNKTYEGRGNCLIEKERKEEGVLSCNRKKEKVLVFGCQSSIIPDDVTMIDSYAFSGCRELTQIIIPNNIQFIGSRAFEYCDRLVEVINKSNIAITEGEEDLYTTGAGGVGYYAKQIFTEIPAVSNFIEQGGYLFYNDNGTYYLLGYKGSETELVLPESINGNSYELKGWAFNNTVYTTKNTERSGTQYISFVEQSNITSIIIPNGITTISAGAFRNCNGLTSITIPDSVTTIKGDAFRGCSSLEYIIIGEKVTSIGLCAFDECDNLKRIYSKTTYSKVRIERNHFKCNDSIIRPSDWCFYSEESTGSGYYGYYWHYDTDGITPVIW